MIRQNSESKRSILIFQGFRPTSIVTLMLFCSSNANVLVASAAVWSIGTTQSIGVNAPIYFLTADDAVDSDA